MNYKEYLVYQPVLTPSVISIVEKLKSGEITSDMFHNRKYYAKKTENLVRVLEYSIAWEIFNMIKESKE